MKNGSMRVVRPSGAIMRNGSFTAMLAAVALGVCGLWGTGVASGQIFQPTIPDFEPAAVFEVDVGRPYGLASADFLRKPELNEPAMAGQDGYPEIAVAGAGVDYFSHSSFSCGVDPEAPSVYIMRNTGDWDPDPLNGLVEHQRLDIPPNIRTTELVFADVTGENGPDLVLLGYNYETLTGYMLVYKNHGDGFFDDGIVEPPAEFLVSGLSLRGLVAEDFDLDGDIDIIAAASNCIQTGQNDEVVVFENLFAQTQMFGFNAPVTHSLGISGATAPGDIVAGDFFPFGPGTPLLDFVTSNTLGQSTTKAANLGNLQFGIVNEDRPSDCAFTWDFITATSGLFGADTLWDFAAVREEDLAVSVFKGVSAGQFENNCDWDPNNGAAPYQVFPPNEGNAHLAHGISSGRLNADAYPDLVVAIRHYNHCILTDCVNWNGAVGILLGLPDGSFKTPSEDYAYIFDTEGLSGKDTAGAALIEVVDMNGDGFDDIVVSNHESSAEDNISVLINKMIGSIGP